MRQMPLAGFDFPVSQVFRAFADGIQLVADFHQSLARYFQRHTGGGRLHRCFREIDFNVLTGGNHKGFMREKFCRKTIHTVHDLTPRHHAAVQEISCIQADTLSLFVSVIHR